MSGLEHMLKEFSDLAELKAFAESQFKTILELNRRIKQLEQENESLKDLTLKNAPIISNGDTQLPSFIRSGNLFEEHEENICRMEIKKLHDQSMQRPLTMEEAKKLDIYTKLIIQLSSHKKNKPIDVSKVETNELLNILDNSND